MMITGVSGQTGAGKSTLADYLSDLGLGENLEVDQVGHQMLTDAEVRGRLVSAFGSQILAADGEICRKALGREAFASETNIEKLNSIMHPAMVERVKAVINSSKKRGNKYLIVNAALLFSMGLDKLCDRIVYVVTSAEIRLQRLTEYRNWSEESARERLFAQDDLPEGRQDIIIVRNDKTEKDLAKAAEKIAKDFL
jgi:dephospho-CoA kinase